MFQFVLLADNKTAANVQPQATTALPQTTAPNRHHLHPPPLPVTTEQSTAISGDSVDLIYDDELNHPTVREVANPGGDNDDDVGSKQPLDTNHMTTGDDHQPSARPHNNLKLRAEDEEANDLQRSRSVVLQNFATNHAVLNDTSLQRDRRTHNGAAQGIGDGTDIGRISPLIGLTADRIQAVQPPNSRVRWTSLSNGTQPAASFSITTSNRLSNSESLAGGSSANGGIDDHDIPLVDRSEQGSNAAGRGALQPSASLRSDLESRALELTDDGRPSVADAPRGPERRRGMPHFQQQRFLQQQHFQRNPSIPSVIVTNADGSSSNSQQGSSGPKRQDFGGIISFDGYPNFDRGPEMIMPMVRETSRFNAQGLDRQRQRPRVAPIGPRVPDRPPPGFFGPEDKGVMFDDDRDDHRGSAPSQATRNNRHFTQPPPIPGMVFPSRDTHAPPGVSISHSTLPPTLRPTSSSQPPRITPPQPALRAPSQSFGHPSQLPAPGRARDSGRHRPPYGGFEERPQSIRAGANQPPMPYLSNSPSFETNKPRPSTIDHSQQVRRPQPQQNDQRFRPSPSMDISEPFRPDSRTRHPTIDHEEPTSSSPSSLPIRPDRRPQPPTMTIAHDAPLRPTLDRNRQQQPPAINHLDQPDIEEPPPRLERRPTIDRRPSEHAPPPMQFIPQPQPPRGEDRRNTMSPPPQHPSSPSVWEFERGRQTTPAEQPSSYSPPPQLSPTRPPNTWHYTSEPAATEPPHVSQTFPDFVENLRRPQQPPPQSPVRTRQPTRIEIRQRPAQQSPPPPLLQPTPPTETEHINVRDRYEPLQPPPLPPRELPPPQDSPPQEPPQQPRSGSNAGIPVEHGQPFGLIDYPFDDIQPIQPSTRPSTTTTVQTTPQRPRQPLRTRPTTPVEPKTTATTPRPTRRNRPKLKKQKVHQLSHLPQRSASRPQALYESPPVGEQATKCDKNKCVLPDCNCGSPRTPAGLPTKDIPQIVLLTFDDAVNDLNWEIYQEIFDTGRKNPNGCPLLATFYVSHEWTDYSQVQTLYSKGHEMASHGVT